MLGGWRFAESDDTVTLEVVARPSVEGFGEGWKAEADRGETAEILGRGDLSVS